MIKLSRKNTVTAVSSALLITGGLIDLYNGTKKTGKNKAFHFAVGITGAVIGMLGIAKVIEEEFKPVENKPAVDEEDYGTIEEDDFFKDLEEELIDDKDREDEDYGNEEVVTETIVSDPDNDCNNEESVMSAPGDTETLV